MSIQLPRVSRSCAGALSTFAIPALAGLAVAVLSGDALYAAEAQPAASTAVAPASPVSISPVTDAMLLHPDPGSWLMWRGNLSGWQYSELKQVTARNVGQLRLVWSRGMGPGAQEAMPLVHDGMMYLPNPSDYTQAIDAATGDLKWEYRRPVPEDIAQYFPAPSANRSLAIYGKLIYDSGLDNYSYAIDAETGKLAWETKVLDYKKGAKASSGPFIAHGKLISTRGCEPEGGPDACVIVGHDPVSGKELWRTRTIPKPGELGDESWAGLPDAERQHVGTWMVPSYDPELNLIYVGTSVTHPAPKFMLTGNDNQYLYHDSTLAINPDTGKIVWYYQHLVDHWDLDHTFERILVDTQVAPNKNEVAWMNPRIKPGERRKVLTGIPGKTGVVYTLDRATGEFLWARPTIKQTVVGSIDGATGKVTVNPEAVFKKKGDSAFICPTLNGGKNWWGGAYSPLTNAMYFSLQNTCGTVTAIADKPSPDSLYAVTGRGELAPGTTNVGSIYAISVATGETLWKYEQRSGTLSLLATGSGLLFAGDVNGRFRAMDQKTGKILWEMNLGASVTGYPITYSVKGKQYVAVSTGGPFIPMTSLTPELKIGSSNQMFVFALPDR